MWELDHKEGWASKNSCFWIVVLEKMLESPLDNREINPVNPEGNQPEYSLKGTILKLKLQYFGHLMQRTNSSERLWCWERFKAERKEDDKKKRGWQRMRWLDRVTGSMDMSLSRLQELVIEGKAWRAAVHRVTKCWTGLSNWTDLKSEHYVEGPRDEGI